MKYQQSWRTNKRKENKQKLINDIVDGLSLIGTLIILFIIII